MRRKIKKMDCIEYLSVQAPLEKVNMLEDKQSKYIHEPRLFTAMPCEVIKSHIITVF